MEWKNGALQKTILEQVGSGENDPWKSNVFKGLYDATASKIVLERFGKKGTTCEKTDYHKAA